jgi:transcriptional regulator with XRE-family HTH domain
MTEEHHGRRLACESEEIYERQFNAKEFGQRLKYLRKKYGKTQQDIADLLLVSVDSVSRYENGKTIIGHDYVVILCNFFNISADFFYFNVDRTINNERWIDEIVILLNGKTEKEIKKVYEILKLVFQ